MKLQAVTIGLLLHLSTMGFAMYITPEYQQQINQYTMPTSEVLKTRLKEFDKLIAHTDLINHVAERRLVECDIVAAAELAIYDYLEFLRRKGNSGIELQFSFEQLQKSKPRLITLLLLDFPDILKNVKSNGAFKAVILN